MSTPITEAPYRPLPEGPSPVWARAGRGLGFMALVALAQVPFNLVAGLTGFAARERLTARASIETVQPLLIAASVTQTIVHVGASVVTAYALATVAALPAWTRARALARASLALCVVAFARPIAQFALVTAAQSPDGSHRSAVLVGAVTFTLDLALAAAITATLAVLLTRLTTALDAPRPRRLWGLVAFGLILRLLSPLGIMVQTLGAGRLGSAALVVLLVSTALWALQSWGWARALRSVARVVGAQSLPASAVGPRVDG